MVCTNYIRDKNKLGFLKGSMLEPNVSDPKRSLWKQCSDIVRSWIHNSLIQELANSVPYIETLVDILASLEECFSQGDFY